MKGFINLGPSLLNPHLFKLEQLGPDINEAVAQTTHYEHIGSFGLQNTDSFRIQHNFRRSCIFQGGNLK